MDYLCPTFLYLKVSQNVRKEQIVQEIQCLLSKICQYEKIKELHLTLSAQIQITPFEGKQLANTISHFVKKQIINLPILLIFKQVRVLQQFVTLQVQNLTVSKVKPIVDKINAIFQNKYFEEPIFHVSLFKITSQMTLDISKQIQSIRIKNKKGFSLNQLYLKVGIIDYLCS